MRLLFVTPFLPDRHAAHGGGAYLGALMTALRPLASIGLCALTDPEAPEPQPPHAWDWLAAVPHVGHAGGIGSRLQRLWRWRCLPLVAAKAWAPGMVAAIARAKSEFRPDVAFVEMAQMAQYLPYLRSTPTVLTDHEAGCPANIHTGLGGWGDRRDRALWAKFIRTRFPQATTLQAVTREDAETLGTLVHRQVLVRPPAIDLPSHPVAPGQTPPRALFLGDYRHAPNPEAARRLVSEVFPILRAAIANVELWLAGPNEEPIRALEQTPGVRVLGFQPQLNQVFGQVRLLLAPLWSGSGFRVKTMTALAHGLPVVTNRLGSRGCSAPPPAMTTAETPEGIAAQAITLLQSSALAQAAGRAAYEWAGANLSAEAVARQQLAYAQTLSCG